MESSMAVFLLRQSACELLPTIPDVRHLPTRVRGGSLPDFEPNMNESLLGQASLLGKPEPLRQASACWASLGQLFDKDSHLTKAEERCDVVVVVVCSLQHDHYFLYLPVVSTQEGFIATPVLTEKAKFGTLSQQSMSNTTKYYT